MSHQQPLQDVSPALAVATGTFLSGAMMSLSLLAVPVFTTTTTEPAQLTREWAKMYHYGHSVMPAISIATVGLYTRVIYARRRQKRQWAGYAAAGAVTLLMLPFTWFIMAPTNNQLFAFEDARVKGLGAATFNEVLGLVNFWRQLHIVRSLFPLAGAAIGARNFLGGW
ncbi:Anthrone oxygenase [Lachnellula arida]|uniref:Anthrone oxygenase n=1 Tax=Lachnellula arida TaxID=1316785 RepID=A0A8T9BKR0_9HELO|nr:Anthrone oxygenase [Lachnellula arida]